MDGLAKGLPRIFLVEVEYHAALRAAEIEWIRSLLKELHDGTLTGVDAWRAWHETGHVPDDFAELASIGRIPTDEEDGDPDS
jgi:hypothetical protein